MPYLHEERCHCEKYRVTASMDLELKDPYGFWPPEPVVKALQEAVKTCPACIKKRESCVTDIFKDIY